MNISLEEQILSKLELQRPQFFADSLSYEELTDPDDYPIIFVCIHNFTDHIVPLVKRMERELDKELFEEQIVQALFLCTSFSYENEVCFDILFSFRNTDININRPVSEFLGTILSEIIFMSNGNDKYVKKLLKHPLIDLNGDARVGLDSPLMMSCSDSYKDIFNCLIEDPRTDVNFIGQYGYTALIWCAFYDNCESAEKLLQFPSIDIHIISEDGFNALGMSLKYKRFKMAKMLDLNTGLDVSLKKETSSPQKLSVLYSLHSMKADLWLNMF